MSKHTFRFGRYTVAGNMLVLAVLSVASSFALGIRTSGDVQTVAPSQASDAVIHGDMNADTLVDVRDAIAILEVVRGYSDPTTAQLQADPNGDGHLTLDDALWILHSISTL